jgi:hypothetical protein
VRAAKIAVQSFVSGPRCLAGSRSDVSASSISDSAIAGIDRMAISSSKPGPATGRVDVARERLVEVLEALGK